MGGHILVLSCEAVGLAGAIGGVYTLGLSKVGIETVFVAPLGGIVGVVYGGSEWAGGDADSCAVITVKVVGAVYHTDLCGGVTVEGGVFGADVDTSPGGVVGIGAGGALLHAKVT